MCTRCSTAKTIHDPDSSLNIKISCTFELVVDGADFVLEADPNADPVFELVHLEFDFSVLETYPLLDQHKSSRLSLTLGGQCSVCIKSHLRPAL